MDAAILFDMDDTLAATGPVWLRAERRLFEALGREYRPDIAARYKGLNARDVGATIRRELGTGAQSEGDCGELMRAFLLEEFAAPVAPMPGADALVRALAPHYGLAVASGSPAEAIRSVLERAGWIPLFRETVSSESVAKGKPAPDVFLAAAARLTAAPQRCLVFEDSLHGVRAARAAGMKCFVVPSLDDRRIAGLADRVFESLADVRLDDVREALG
jgi:HAD superfamily hydrolase (TIGR01509 family)